MSLEESFGSRDGSKTGADLGFPVPSSRFPRPAAAVPSRTAQTPWPPAPSLLGGTEDTGL